MIEVREVFGVRVLSGQWQVFQRDELYSIRITDDEATADAICKILNDAIATAREEGRKQGIEEAAQVADAGWKLFSNRGDEAQYACEWVETEIRALAKG